MDYHQWQVVFIHFGDYLEEFEEGRVYTKADFPYGVNVGREFSKPHMAIILSPNPLCRGDTILVAPITKYTPGDEERWDKIVLEKERESFLEKKSSIHLSAIRVVSKQRILRPIFPYIHKSTQREIKKRITSFFRIL
jgi:mRNA-degrading endonuclease toxin of MazEF toxin-antitoxin module